MTYIQNKAVGTATAVAVGAAVGVAATLLADGNNRKKVGKIVSSIRHKGDKHLSEISDKIENARSKIDEKLNPRFERSESKKFMNAK